MYVVCPTLEHLITVGPRGTEAYDHAMRFPHLALAAGLISALATPSPDGALAWTAGGSSVATSDSSQTMPIVVGDATGGVYVFWSDYRYYNLTTAGFSPPVAGERVTGNGGIAPGWPAIGLQLPWRSSEAGQMAIPDGAGGVYVATGGWDWYGHVLINHLGADGQAIAPWPSDAAEIAFFSGPAPANGGPAHPFDTEGAGPGDIMPAITLDGAGGVLLAWTHVGKASQAVHVARLTDTGAIMPSWPANGVMVQLTYASQWCSTICDDGAHGAFVAWSDELAETYACHVFSDGTLDARWPSGGLLASDPTGTATAPGIVSDGNGGCLIVWQLADALGAQHPVVQHLLADGTAAPGWGPHGNTLSTAATEAGAFRIGYGQPFTYSSLVSDGSGGVIVAWSAIANGAGQVYAQRVLGSGAVAAGWPAGGLAVAPAPADQRLPSIAGDGAGGAFLAWQASDEGATEIRVQHVDGGGETSPWPSGGYEMAIGAGARAHPVVAADGLGGAIVAWEEPHGNVSNIFVGSSAAPIVTATPRVAPKLDFALRGFAPNPARLGALQVALTLPGAAPARLELLDLSGRRLLEREVGELGPGVHVVPLDGAGQLRSGVYWLRLEQDGRAVTTRGVVMR